MFGIDSKPDPSARTPSITLQSGSCASGTETHQSTASWFVQSIRGSPAGWVES
jgi:hypothetical protein